MRRLIGDPHEAEDVAQDVFIKLYLAMPHLQDRGDDFLPWLNRVARNQGTDKLRRRRFQHVEDPADLVDRLERVLTSDRTTPVEFISHGLLASVGPPFAPCARGAVPADRRRPTLCSGRGRARAE